ncbi:placenta-specific gene 8 protein-like [Corythoichthys intestinalis]|uniref:placenta-specific gene 8 protein-like n=1 Tax=Corythoichthys intestinalis TaxID=161448 RepID=UPI0025A6838A|nr:placenta-specific gene 8 protein-like [Corythoichthys intestinalis]XP_061790949.1 placenta-specific gene 8 protein-like [Nerophis lumbriciformis]
MDSQSLVNWHSGLCDCFESASTCCYGFWCCPCLACTVAGKYGENRCLPLCDVFAPAAFASCGIPCFVPPAVLSLRASMRGRYGIKGNLCKDILASCFCVWCSWCQMHREIKHRSKTPVVLNVHNQTIVHQPAPIVMMQPAPAPQIVMMDPNPAPPYYPPQK